MFCSSECLLSDIMKHVCCVAHILSEGGCVMKLRLNFERCPSSLSCTKTALVTSDAVKQHKAGCLLKLSVIREGMNSTHFLVANSESTHIKQPLIDEHAPRVLQTNYTYAHFNMDFFHFLVRKIIYSRSR